MSNGEKVQPRTNPPFTRVRAAMVAKMQPNEVKRLRVQLWESMKGCNCREHGASKRDGCTKKIMRCPGRMERWFADLKRLGLPSPRDKR